MKKESNQKENAVGAKQIFGVTAMSSTGAMASCFMTSMFMMFMTDYAGLGPWGPALTTSVLLFARFFDLVIGPVSGFVMDNAKPGRLGKYRKFLLFSMITITLGCVLIYAIPDLVAASPVSTAVWVIAFTLLYDIGVAFNSPNLLYRTMTEDPAERSKLIIGPRMLSLSLGIAASAFTPAVVALRKTTGSFKTAHQILVLTSCTLALTASLIGWLCVREKSTVQRGRGDKVRFRDFVELLRENKAMVVQFCKNLFAGFIWTLMFATPTYYLKWTYCADLTTGVTDMETFGFYSMIQSLMMVIPMMLGTFLAPPLMRLFRGSPISVSRFLLLVEAACGFAIFIFHTLGILPRAIWLFFGLFFLMATAIGAETIPQNTVDMEIMDYTVYKTGKDRSALTGVLGKLLGTVQGAMSTAIVGSVLIAIGYRVDAVTGDYAGELAALPGMLGWFAAIMGLFPCLLALAAWAVYRKYPINAGTRAQMRQALEK